MVERAELDGAVRDDRRGTAASIFRGPRALVLPRGWPPGSSCRVAIVAPEPWLAAAADRVALAGLVAGLATTGLR